MAHHHISGWAIFIIILILFLLLSYALWVLYSRRRASRLGLAPPSLNPFARSTPSSSYPSPRAGGLVGWINDKIRAFKNRRYASGAYEEGRADAQRGGRMEADEAWDARVGHEGYYEEQELGLQAPTQYGGSGYGAPAHPPVHGGQPLNSPYVAQEAGFQHESRAHEEERGRSRTRDLGPGAAYGEEGRPRTPLSTRSNPFGDNAEPSNMSLRGVSPRPIDTEGAAKGHQQQNPDKSAENSPTERRSMFREEM